MLKWVKMAEARKERELKRLEIDTKQEQLPPAPEGTRQLRARSVKAGPGTRPPSPPGRSSSVPVADQGRSPPTVAPRRLNQRDLASEPMSHVSQNVGSSGLDSTDVESINNQLEFAANQLKERHRLQSESREVSSAENSTPQPTIVRTSREGSHHTESPSSDDVYQTPLKQEMQRPAVIGEVYFDFRDNQYKLIQTKHPIGPDTGLYHSGRDKCFYFATDNQWRMTDRARFPFGTKFVEYKTGELAIPQWDMRGGSILTPPPEHPLQTAFQPVHPPQFLPEIPAHSNVVTRPTPQYHTFRPPTTGVTTTQVPQQLPTTTHQTPNIHVQTKPKQLWNVSQPNPSPVYPPTVDSRVQHSQVYHQPIPSYQPQYNQQPFPPQAQFDQVETDRQLAFRLQEVERARFLEQQRQQQPNLCWQCGMVNHHPDCPNNPRANREVNFGREEVIPTSASNFERPIAQTDAYNQIVDRQTQRAPAFQEQVPPLPPPPPPEVLSHQPMQNRPPQTRPRQRNTNPRSDYTPNFGQNREDRNQRGVRNPRANPWTSTPHDNRQNQFPNQADPNSSFPPDFNNSLLSLLESQTRVQHDTSQTLARIMEMQVTKANDSFINDLDVYSGDPTGFLDWILKVEKISRLTGRAARELATAKSEGPVYKCLCNIPQNASWEDCKRLLRENFSNLQTKQHASVRLMTRAQKQDETLQEFIYQFAELVRLVSGQEPNQVTDPLKVIIFNKHLFNREIKKTVAKGSHRTLKEAFDSALAAERKAKKFEGLTDDDPTVMAVQAGISAEINQVVSSGTKASEVVVKSQPPTNQPNAPPSEYFGQNRHRNNNTCWKCGGKGHYARECPPQNQSGTSAPGYLPFRPPNPFPKFMPTTGNPKLVQTITSESQVPMNAWNALLTELGQAKMENRQMKQFVKKQFPRKPFGNRPPNQQKTQQVSQPKHQGQQASKTQTHKINQVEASVPTAESDIEDSEEIDIPPFIWDEIQAEQEIETEPEYSESAEIVAKINVVIDESSETAAEFPVCVGTYSTKCTFDTGATHSCVSSACAEKAFPGLEPVPVPGMTVKNASGKSMAPIGMLEVRVTIGDRSFKHPVIVCRQLASDILIGLDFASRFRIGSDWTSDGYMYLHQGSRRLAIGSVKGVSDKSIRMVLKTTVTIPPGSMAMAASRVVSSENIQPNQYFLSSPDPWFESQFGDVSSVPLMHKIPEKNPQDLAVCLINPGDWPVTIPKNKTVQHLTPVKGTVHINKVFVEQDPVEAGIDQE